MQLSRNNAGAPTNTGIIGIRPPFISNTSTSTGDKGLSTRSKQNKNDHIETSTYHMRDEAGNSFGHHSNFRMFML